MSVNRIALGKRISFYRLKFSMTQEKLADLTVVVNILPILKTESRPPVCQSWLISPMLYIFLSIRYWLTASIILFLPLIPIYIASY